MTMKLKNRMTSGLRQTTKPFSGLFVLFAFYLALVPRLSYAAEIAENVDTRYGGTIIIGTTGDVDSFNPLFNESAMAQEITHLLLLGLADLNDKSEFVPELARSWRFSEDHLQLTYRLRKDAVWSDGVPVTAADVKFTFDLLRDTTVASPRQGVTEYIKSVHTPDAHTVVFEFTRAYPDQMFDTAGEILPKHVFKDVPPHEIRSHPFGRTPIASGPYRLKRWVSQQFIELVPNERYFGERPYLQRIVFKIVPDQSNLLMQLQSGEVDMMLGVPPSEVQQLKKSNPNLNIYPVSGRVYYYLGYNEKRPVFADKTVRQALTMAIDRRAIIDAFLYGFGKPCLGPIPPMIQWVSRSGQDPFQYAPQKSRQLLAQQGWQDTDGDGWLDKDGRTFSFTIKTNAGNQLRADVAVILQEQFRRIGVKVDIQTLEWTALMDELREKQFDAYMGGWSTSFNVDLTPIFHSSATDLFNFVSYANPQVDRLIEAGREELDIEKAGEIWGEAQKLIYEDQPYSFLFWIDKVVAVNKQFKNVTPIPLSLIYDIEKWYKLPVN